MKGESRQHGVVRTYPVLPPPWNLKLDTPPVQMLNSAPAVPSKLINHPKFIRKCGKPNCLECHLNPVGKSKDKTKGTQKVRTSHLVVNPKLITWRVVDKRPGLNFSGFSATGMLDHLYNFSGHDQDGEIYDHVNDYGHDGSCEDGGPCGLVDGSDDDENFLANFWSLHEKQNEEQVEIEDYGNDDDDDAMSHCDVGFMLEQTEEDEGWCLLTDV